MCPPPDIRATRFEQAATQAEEIRERLISLSIFLSKEMEYDSTTTLRAGRLMFRSMCLEFADFKAWLDRYCT